MDHPIKGNTERFLVERGEDRQTLDAYIFGGTAFLVYLYTSPIFLLADEAEKGADK